MNHNQIRTQINRKLTKLGIYHTAIPLTAIFEILRESGVEPVQEDGTKWSGFLCGDNASTTINLSGVKGGLYLSWYKMPQSGRYEITVYVS